MRDARAVGAAYHEHTMMNEREKEKGPLLFGCAPIFLGLSSANGGTWRAMM